MNDADNTRRLEHWVHLSLLGGLLISGIFLIVGLVVVLLDEEPRPKRIPPPLGNVLADAASGNGVALIDLGLLFLICTPVVRVAVLALGWGVGGDRRFMIVALVVLALLGLSFLLGVG